MSAYVKKIAVIKQVKSGFSADGGAISGLVKAETYAGFLKVEVSLINFAPLTEGRYVFGISDGLNTAIFESLSYEGEEKLNLSGGFAFLVCFCHNKVAPIASAACGQMACALPDLKEEMTKLENLRPKGAGVAYDDEAIAEENYYEQSDEGGTAVRTAQTQEEVGAAGGENASAAGSVQGEAQPQVIRAERGARTQTFHTDNAVRREEEAAPAAAASADSPDTEGGLAGGDFYSRMEGDIKKIFATYPKEADLESAIVGSRFAKIEYGEGKYYVFGVLSVEGKPRYICYGVPAQNAQVPPPSLKELADYVPCKGGGYWMTYQDAATGVSIRISVT